MRAAFECARRAQMCPGLHGQLLRRRATAAKPPSPNSINATVDGSGMTGIGVSLKLMLDAAASPLSPTSPMYKNKLFVDVTEVRLKARLPPSPRLTKPVASTPTLLTASNAPKVATVLFTVVPPTPVPNSLASAGARCAPGVNTVPDKKLNTFRPGAVLAQAAVAQSVDDSLIESRSKPENCPPEPPAMVPLSRITIAAKLPASEFKLAEKTAVAPCTEHRNQQAGRIERFR